MDVLGIFSAFGLSASAGLNAYIPLLVVALLARFTTITSIKRTLGCTCFLVDYWNSHISFLNRILCG